MILLLGASGYLGRAFADELHRRGAAVTPFSRQTVDYTRFDILFNYVRGARPDFIINAAGFAGDPVADGCESNRAETVRANTLLPQTIARVCYLTSTPWGHVSSGSIYSGAKVALNGGLAVERDLNQPDLRKRLESQPQDFHGFDESDEPNFTFRSPPCTFYSGTKALAEEAMRGFSQHYLWRPGIVFDEVDHPRNFLAGTLRHALVRDNVNSFSHRADFVRTCLDLWDSKAPFGTYHIVNPGMLSGRQLLDALQRKIRPQGAFQLLSENEGGNTPRHRALHPHCILSSSKLASAGIKLRPLSLALDDALENWKPSESQENINAQPTRISSGPFSTPS